ncbi:MAG: 50S ribosomal protein L3 [Alteromonadaceae bacterium]|nr:MAG: 50S ribosomal protein L3 [Alteromonadaceae bacterium]
MTIGIVGRKSGMTRIFTDDGVSIPVSVVEAEPNRITQVKTSETDGYNAVQVTAGSRKSSRVVKPRAGHFAKAEAEAGRGLWELRNDAGEAFELGGQITVEGFTEGQIVDVTGVSKGKGFAGGVKRWNFAMQDATHGNSLSHRAPGSIGQCQTPGRVFKGKHMAGHMGSAQVTTQNLEVIKVDVERGLLLIKGAIPGAPGGDVIIRPAVKNRDKA